MEDTQPKSPPNVEIATNLLKALAFSRIDLPRSLKPLIGFGATIVLFVKARNWVVDMETDALRMGKYMYTICFRSASFVPTAGFGLRISSNKSAPYSHPPG